MHRAPEFHLAPSRRPRFKHVVLMVAVLIVAGGATARAQTTQQAGDQNQSGANAPKSKTAADPAAPKSQGAPASSSASTPPASPASTPSGTAPASKPAATQQNLPAKSANMVWVNTDSGVYHMRETRWYGKTKKGKYMTEADAIRAGYKPAKKE